MYQWIIKKHDALARIKSDILLSFATLLGSHSIRDGNGPGRRVKRQSRGLIRPSKSHIRVVRSIPPGLKILAHPTCGSIFSGPAQPVQTCSAVQFFKISWETYFLSILDYEYQSYRFYCYKSIKFYFILTW
jgi:hypothetical protein